jgi:putative transposase
MNKGLKLRIYPTQKQAKFLNNNLGACRFIYNQMLNERITIYQQLKNDKEKLYTHKYKTVKQYKQEFEWLEEMDAYSLGQANRHLQTAYANFYKSLKKLRKGTPICFPKFKSKHQHNDSYECRQTIKLNFNKQEIKIPKITTLKFKHRKNIKSWYRNATLKCITISKSPTGKYYASCLFDGENDCLPKRKIIKTVGLDMSMDKFYIDNIGNSPEYNKNYRQLETKLAKAQRKLSRKSKDSKRREKQRIKVAKIHETIKNKRHDFLDKLSFKLVHDYDAICVENLSLKGMSQALHLGKSVMDLGYSTFVNKLKYKSEWYGCTLVMADRWFASSKTCHVCGFIKKDLMLQERKWVCPSCGTMHHRDINAAQNLNNLISREAGKFTLVDIKALASEALAEDVELGGRSEKIIVNQ